MSDSRSPADSAHGPLTPSELAELESTLLPALERHHLRLLAHALRTLQTIAGREQGAPPTPADLAGWAASQPDLAGDPAFTRVFLEQLEGAGSQLAAIAAGLATSALALELSQLCGWARNQADTRLRRDSGI
ncbi:MULTISPECIES: hypothetical protein [Aphanothece]|uniref:hypothetical protein n=1 Tax=Aphanothece TaxID=1121 RepID=UPI0039851221